MPKMKTCKSIAKRIRVTPRGKVICTKSGRRHLLSSKTSKRKRHMRRPGFITGKMVKTIKHALQKTIT